jgi:hypothetical protein
MYKLTILTTVLLAIIAVGSHGLAVKALTNEQIGGQNKAYFNSVVWPGFQEDCKKELGIATNQFLTGENMMKCKISQLKWNDKKPIPEDVTFLATMNHSDLIDVIKTYLEARYGG